jgi:type IX secretion system PorP/SprF family membrane protein
MKRNLLWLVFAAVLFFRLPAGAQDPHFSQFFASPLSLNPAFTGLFSGDLRFSANYRNQWSSIATPFVTGTVAADVGILKSVVPYNDIWGAGLMVLYDQTGGGGLRSSYIGLSTAYHKGLDAEGSKSLAVGFQLALEQKRLDFSKLLFENQLTNQGFDPSMPNGEYIANSSVSYADYNVGLLYNASVGQYGNYYVGASYYHITEPNESFLGDKYPLRSRFTFHGGGGFAPTPLTRVYLSGLFMRQAGATEADMGGAFGFVINNQPMDANLFYIGSWYRWGDAINPYVGLEINNLHIGISYDINVSALRAASNYRGGLELSLIYIYEKPGEHSRGINCPKF